MTSGVDKREGTETFNVDRDGWMRLVHGEEKLGLWVTCATLHPITQIEKESEPEVGWMEMTAI